MPYTAITDADLLGLLSRAGRPLPLGEIVDHVGASVGRGEGIARSTVAARLRQLEGSGQIRNLSLREAQELGAVPPGLKPNARLYVCTQLPPGQQATVTEAADAAGAGRETLAEAVRFREAVAAAYQAFSPRDPDLRLELRPFVLGPGFLWSFWNHGQSARGHLLKAVVRVLTNRNDVRRQPQRVQSYQHVDGTIMDTPGLWAAVASHLYPDGPYLVWRALDEDGEQRTELVGAAPADRLTVE